MIEIYYEKCVICHKEKEKSYYKFCDECWDDNDKINKYHKSLEKRRKYTKGEVINSFDELLEQEFVYLNGKIYHKGWFQSWQFRLVANLLKSKRLHKAIKKVHQ